MRASCGYQFLLLLWKNYVLHKRKWLVTLLEVALPTFFTFIFILIRQRVDSNRIDNATVWQPISVDQLPKDLKPIYSPEWHLIYAPSSPLTDHLVKDVVKHLNKVDQPTGFRTEEKAVQFMENTDNMTVKSTLAAIIFSTMTVNTNASITELPANITYKIRLPSRPRTQSKKMTFNPFSETGKWLTQFTYPVVQSIGPREKSHSSGGAPGYIDEGFVTLQLAIDRAITRFVDPKGKSMAGLTTIVLRRMPYPPYLNDRFVLVIQQQFPLMIMLSFIFSALNIVKNIVHEKERRLKESMKMMGLLGWLHWLAWFVTYFLLLAVSIAIMTGMLVVNVQPKGSVLTFSSPSLIFIFLMLFGTATIFFSFAVSTFFSKANSAAAAGGILFFGSYIPYFFLQPRYHQLSLGAKMAACLIPNVAMAMGGQLVGMFEGAEAGIQWGNMNQGVSVDDSFTISHVLVMFIVDSVLYMLIAWYVESVRPGEYGVPQPFYFPFQRSYWFGTKSSLEEAGPGMSQPTETTPLDPKGDQASTRRHRRHLSLETNADFFEAEPMGLRPGIQIVNLKKVYGSGPQSKLAVSDMTLNMYEGQITVLLGHNGAGKTTTMSMLTGFIPPTSGTALVNGFDIGRDIASVRESLGLCPQHDILFDQMTVEEHLKFFGRLKGCSGEQLTNEITDILNRVNLPEKRTALAKTLSGGMKRKLSVAIALIGGSKVVVLDEPTSGLDPDARREMWTVLQAERAGRTMLLTTHFMDEADLLGDRIAIMASGVVQCCGSALFLKGKYGAGYHMTLVKAASCDVSAVLELVQSHVPGMRIESNVSEELSLVLPSESSPSFEHLFAELETKREELGILSYGASVTTMEEVFLRVGNYQAELEAIQSDKRERYGSFTALSSVSSENSSVNLNPGDQDNDFETSNSSSRDTRTHFYETHNAGIELFLQQFYGLFIKRFKHSVRNKLVTVAQLLIPVLFTVSALTVIKTWPGPDDSPSLPLTLDKFGSTIIAYSTDKNNMTHAMDNVVQHYIRQFYDRSGTQFKFVNEEKGWQEDPDYQKYLVAQATKSIFRFNHQYIIGAEFHKESSDSSDQMEVIAYFNDQPYHAPGVTLNAITNGILRTINSSLQITTVNHPLPRTLMDKVNDEYNEETTGFTLAFNLLFGMAFLVSSVTLFLIRERSIKAKHLQFVSGVNIASYWLSTFLWDLVNYLVPCILVLITFLAFNLETYVDGGRIWDVALILGLYGWAVIPLMYLLSNFFSVPSTGLVWLTMFNILSGIATLMAVTILSIPQLGLQDLARSLEWLFLVLLPNFAFGEALTDFYENHMFLSFCTDPKVTFACDFLHIQSPCCKNNCGNFCAQWNEDYLGWAPNGVGRMLTFLSIQGLVFFSIVFFLDSSSWKRVWRMINPERGIALQRLRRMSRGSQFEEDHDVTNERHDVNNTTDEELMRKNCLVLREVSKFYGSLCAVDRMTCAVPPGECFGLLGVNGAGKTTTFKMVTGDLDMTAGEAFINGHRVTQDVRKVQQSLGYCPQFDALIDQLTGRETLTMFARLRGLREALIAEEVETLIRSLNLVPYADKLVSSYSGGNRRKLSTALGLVGSPPLVCLDEPTTGMDPLARRHLWNTLARYRDSGRTLILTSHSMEECEALCTKIGIMVNGQLKCLGACQHLKAKFGQGYTLLAQVPYTLQTGGDARVHALIDFIDTNFPKAELKDCHQGLVHYHLHPHPDLSWSRVFGLVEANKGILGLTNYSVSQTTLEQVFLGLARAQRPPDEARRSAITCCSCCGGRQSCCCCPSLCSRREEEEDSLINHEDPVV